MNTNSHLYNYTYGFHTDSIVSTHCFVASYKEIKGTFNKNKDNRKTNGKRTQYVIVFIAWIFAYFRKSF